MDCCELIRFWGRVFMLAGMNILCLGIRTAWCDYKSAKSKIDVCIRLTLDAILIAVMLTAYAWTGFGR